MNIRFNSKLSPELNLGFNLGSNFGIAATFAFWLFISFFSASLSANQYSLQTELKKLENEYQKISSDFFKSSLRQSKIKLKNFTDIEKLLSAIEQLSSAKTPYKSIQLIQFNMRLVEKNIDSKAIFLIIETLLKTNAWKTANTLLQSIKEDGDKSVLSTVEFIFAKYYAEQNNWKQVNALLTDVYSELSEQDAAYAHLIKGNALQHLKKHRDAAKHYRILKRNSEYYQYAQLNIALTNIRQGWWTDAKTDILQQIKSSHKTNKDELVNRLYLILGYALLQREYYRDARDAFRQIGLNSRYTNRALLGIGLTATSQGDFIGALNALTILKDKKTFDISVDESYLLIPYVYEKLHQEVTVTSSYAVAMQYFNQRITQLRNISNQKHNLLTTKYDKENKSIIIRQNRFIIGRKYSPLFISNYKNLSNFIKTSNNKNLKIKASKLMKKYDSIFHKIIQNLAQQRISFLKSYLNQSRYGLARLYDSSSEPK